VTASDPIGPLDDTAASHLTAAFHGTPAELVGGELPYHDLGGAGLERLTFLLLAEDYKVPQYFGKVGDPQYGIDLLVPDGNRVTVYQCKNYRRFSRADLQGVLNKFRAEWLSLHHLPRPSVFVLCCPLDLRARAVSEQWERIRKEFQDDTGVSVEIWHRDYFDERLRKSPDLVADVFSERAAGEFCHPLSWRYDVFRPLHPQAPPDLFLDLDELASFHYRASRILRGRGWLVLVARTAPAEGRGLRFEASELEDELTEAGSPDLPGLALE